jgi:hypothetical protein
LTSITGTPTHTTATRTGTPARTPQSTSSGPGSVRVRRRPLLAIVGVLLAVSASAVAGWAVLNAQNTERVLGIVRTIPAGHPVAVDDLTYVEIPVGSMPAAVRGSDVAEVLGRYATVTLLPGQILVSEALADSLVPPAGFSLVAIAVEAGRLPTVPLEAGDRIDIVSTPAEQEEPPHDRAPDSMAGTVVSTEPLADTTKTIINVQIEQGRAGLLAARAATGRIAVVVGTRER